MSVRCLGPAVILQSHDSKHVFHIKNLQSWLQSTGQMCLHWKKSIYALCEIFILVTKQNVPSLYQGDHS